MDNFISPVNHPESYLSGSTTESMIDRAKELGLSYFAATDNGHLTSIIKAYKYAQKKNIKLIAGIELFFKDDNCDIIKNTPSENIKYFKLVLHAKDQEAYQAIVKKASETGKKKIWVLGHDHSAYTWDDLKELSKYNITACTSNIEGMVSKHLLVNRADLGLKYYQKLKDVFGAENFFPTIIPQKQDKYWNTLVKIKAGGKIVHIPASDRVKTDKYDRARAIELTRPNSKHKELKQVFINKMPFKVKKEYQQIESAELENVFQEIPGGDLQTKANKFIMALADKFGDSDKLLMSSYSYYANKDDKVVQDMKLGEEHRVYQPQYMASTEDVVDYLYNELNLTEKIVKKVVNNTYEWAKLFNNFELKYDYRLPIPESDPKKKLVEIIKQTGRMKWDDPVYLNQFKEEFKLLTENGVIDLVPYFLPIVDIYKFYDQNGHLTGPARGCLTGDTLVYTDKGVKNLKDIEIGDKVISHTGNYRSVLERMKYDVSNEGLLHISAYYGQDGIKLTKDHKLLGIKKKNMILHWDGSIDHNRNNLNDQSLRKWDKAENFSVGDLLFTPWIKNRKVKDIDFFDLGDFFDIKDDNFVYSKQYRYNRLSIRALAKKHNLSRTALQNCKKGKNINPEHLAKIEEALLKENISLEEWKDLNNYYFIKFKRYISVDKGFCNFIGKWIGDGWLASKNNGFGICFNTEERESIDYYTNYLKDLGFNLYENKAKDKKLVQYTVRNKNIASFFKYIFPNYKYSSKTKDLGVFKNLPDEKLKWIIEGLIGADGYIRKNEGSKYDRHCIDTTSANLKNQIKEVLMYLKIPSSISTRESHSHHSNSNYQCKKSFKIKFAFDSHKIKTITKDGYYSRIDKIEETSNNHVYDITVEKDSSYLTTDYIVHNSAGGFLISYLLGITHIDPIKYGLYSSRFLTMDRVQQGNFPDIDCDLESRVPLVGDDGNSGYLFNKYGNKAAQISTRTLLRIKSAILDANRFVNGGTVEPEIQAFAKSLPNTPQGTTDYKFVFGYENGDGSHEPGLLELNDELQKYATERPKEWNIVKRALSLSRQNSRHACFAAGTLVDSNGKVDFIDFAPDFADNKPITTWYSGVKDTVIVSMNNGVSIQCTPDHRFIVGNKEIEAKDLKGEFISYKPFKKTSGDTYVDSDLAFSLGWFLNDGSYIKSKNGDERFEFYFTPEKDDEAKERILEWLNKKGYKVTPAKDREDTYRAYNLPLEFKIKQNTQNKRIPKEFWEWDLRPQRNFMSGLFSANGYCLSTRPTVAIKLTSKLLISDIAIWLHSHGISTSCSYSKPRKTMHHNGTYTSKTTATLSIPHFTNKIAFENLVGFIQKYKSDRLRQIIEDARATEYIPNKVKCLHIEESGKTPVWDFNEPLENVGYINGILVHNCAYVVSDRPIEEDVPIFEVGGVKRVTQYEHKHCEWAGLIKYDFLVVSALQDINLCIKYINHKNKSENLQTGHFLHNDEDAYIWDLPEDKEVFDMLGRGETESVFQLNTTSVTPFVKMIKPQSVIDCATITSLVRPGPLDFVNKETGRNMVEEYVERKYGRSEPDIPVMKEMLPETYGVLVFQEQVTKLAKELAGMNAEDAENVRIGVGKKKQHLIDSLKPVFIEGAAKKVGEETATRIWSMMETFARYGFNKSHAVAYSVISYACAFLKYHYPLEWWASVLSNADDKEINEVFYKYVRDKVLPPDVNTSSEQMAVDYQVGKIRNKLSMISGLGSKAADKIIKHRPYSDIKDFVKKKPCGPSMTRKLIYVGALDSLFKDKQSVESKLELFEKTLKEVEFEDKLASYDEKIKAAKDGKEIEKIERNKARYEKKGPKPHEVDSKYFGLSPKKAFLMKKSIFPTMNLGLMDVLKKDSRVPLTVGKSKTIITDGNGRDQIVLDGEHLQRIDSSNLSKDAYFCVPGYVMDSSVFSYHKDTKRALKLIIDSSGYVSEKVIWPDYDIGELNYPKSLKKGCIAWFVYCKKAGKPYTNIIDITIEEKALD